MRRSLCRPWSQALPMRLASLARLAAGQWPRRLADAWLPRCCVLCNSRLGPGEAGLCEPCRQQLPGRQAQRCRCCGIRLDAPQQPSCDACNSRPPAFDRTLVLADYAAPLDRAIVAMKFHGQRAIAVALGEALGEALAQAVRQAPVTPDDPLPAGLPPAGALPAGVLPAGTLVVAIPLSRERLLERGYNQSQVLAGRVAGALALRRPAGLLRRLWHTDSQSGLNLVQRLENVAGVFDCDLAAGRQLAGRTVLLVDDVMTTGATFDAAADALKCAGAAAVVCLAIARTPFGRLVGAPDARGTGDIV